jgi:hypothetical protein
VREVTQTRLVPRIDIGIQETNGYADDMAALEHVELTARLDLVQLEEDVPIGEDALRDPTTQVPWYQRTSGVSERPPPARVGLAV